MSRQKLPDGTWREVGPSAGGGASGDSIRADSAKGTRRPDVPCPACVHREVCSLKAAMEAVPVTLPDRPSTWPRGLELVGTLSVECAMFRKERGASGAKKAKVTHNWSPEQRAAAAQRLADRRARQKAAAA